MDGFLLVTPRDQLKKWADVFSQTIEKNGGRVLYFSAVEQATKYLNKPHDSIFNVIEVITDPFGDLDDGLWRDVQQAANERHIRMTLATSFGASADLKKLNKLLKEGVNIIDTSSFDIKEYVIERSFQGGTSREKR